MSKQALHSIAIRSGTRTLDLQVDESAAVLRRVPDYLAIGADLSFGVGRSDVERAGRVAEVLTGDAAAGGGRVEGQCGESRCGAVRGRVVFQVYGEGGWACGHEKGEGGEEGECVLFDEDGSVRYVTRVYTPTYSLGFHPAFSLEVVMIGGCGLEGGLVCFWCGEMREADTSNTRFQRRINIVSKSRRG